MATTLREVHSTNRHSWAPWPGSPASRVAPTCELDVLDRVGGGDGFAAGFFYGLLTGEARGSRQTRLGDGALLTTFPGDTTMATRNRCGPSPKAVRRASNADRGRGSTGPTSPGSGWWGMVNRRAVMENGNCPAVALCDVDQKSLQAPADEVQTLTGKAPRRYPDYA